MSAPLRLALPKGRMQQGVLTLLEAAGLPVRLGDRDYRPRLHLDGIEAKLLKPQNILEMLVAVRATSASRDVTGCSNSTPTSSSCATPDSIRCASWPQRPPRCSSTADCRAIDT